jgi:hypothetical protein
MRDRGIIDGEASLGDDSSELWNELREEDDVSKPWGCASVGVDIMDTGVIGSPAVGLLKEILLLGIGVSVGPDICGIGCRAVARRGLAFNSRENSRAIRWSFSIDAWDIMDYFAGQPAQLYDYALWSRPIATRQRRR